MRRARARSRRARAGGISPPSPQSRSAVAAATAGAEAAAWVAVPPPPPHHSLPSLTTPGHGEHSRVERARLLPSLPPSPAPGRASSVVGRDGTRGVGGMFSLPRIAGLLLSIPPRGASVPGPPDSPPGPAALPPPRAQYCGSPGGGAPPRAAPRAGRWLPLGRRSSPRGPGRAPHLCGCPLSARPAAPPRVVRDRSRLGRSRGGRSGTAGREAGGGLSWRRCRPEGRAAAGSEGCPRGGSAPAPPGFGAAASCQRWRLWDLSPGTRLGFSYRISRLSYCMGNFLSPTQL